MRSSEHYLHGLLAASMLFEKDKKLLGSPDNIGDVLKGVGRVMGVSGFRQVHSPNLAKDLLHMDEVCVCCTCLFVNLFFPMVTRSRMSLINIISVLYTAAHIFSRLCRWKILDQLQS